MTRGRKKDLTIPPSRALELQRDYRSRKARYISELEERCRSAEAENSRLRSEVASLRSDRLLQAHRNPHAARAISDMLDSIQRAATAAVSYTQHISQSTQDLETQLQAPATIFRHTDLISNVLHATSESTVRDADGYPSHHNPQRCNDAQTCCGGLRKTSASPALESGQSDDNSECCGGWIDCGYSAEE